MVNREGLSEEPLITGDAIAKRVSELALQITADFQGREMVAVVILKGSIFFATDLLRQLDLDLTVEFIRAKHYEGIHSMGSIHFTMSPERPLTGKHVLIVEDILDTGRTSAAIMDSLLVDQPETLALCVLLDKPSRRTFDIKADYLGFTIENHFVVGYGLDCDERYRHLEDIYVLKDMS